MASTDDAGDATLSVFPSAFLDASVLIPSAISFRGSSRDLVDAGQRGQIRLVVSQDVLDEAERNLNRKAPHALQTFLEQRDQFERVEPTKELVTEVARLIEPKDAHVVAGAIAARTTYLVTYDRRHLLGEALVIRREYGIDVVTPDHVVARLDELSEG